jgi:hypothetical protein
MAYGGGGGGSGGGSGSGGGTAGGTSGGQGGSRAYKKSFGVGYRAVVGGGGSPTYVDTIDYFSIDILGNATDFGEMAEGSGSFTHAAVSDGNRGVFAGGQDAPTTFLDRQEYITIGTLGNGTDSNELTQARTNLGCGAASDGNRGVFFGGVGPPQVNTIDYTNIGSTVDAIDFGDLVTIQGASAVASDGNRALSAGGNTPAAGATEHDIYYITIGTTSNASDFGEINTATAAFCGGSDGHRGIFAGGVLGAGGSPGYGSQIDYITIGTLGNALDGYWFAGLFYHPTGTSNGSRFVRTGGYDAPASDSMEYFQISSISNALDFGELSQPRYGATSTSGA